MHDSSGPSIRAISTRRRSQSATWPARRRSAVRVKSVGSQSETYTFSASAAPTGSLSRRRRRAVHDRTGRNANVVRSRSHARPPRSTRIRPASSRGPGTGGHTVRIPVAIRPVAIAAPAELTFTTATGPSSWNVKTGYAGTLTASTRGLVPATDDGVHGRAGCRPELRLWRRPTRCLPEGHGDPGRHDAGIASASTRTPSRPPAPTWICSSARVRRWSVCRSRR